MITFQRDYGSGGFCWLVLSELKRLGYSIRVDYVGLSRQIACAGVVENIGGGGSDSESRLVLFCEQLAAKLKLKMRLADFDTPHKTPKGWTGDISFDFDFDNEANVDSLFGFPPKGKK